MTTFRFIDTEKELRSILREKDQEIEKLKERVGMCQFIINNRSLSNTVHIHVINF